MVVGPVAPEGGDGERHRQAVVADRVGDAARQRPRRPHVKAVREFVGVGAEGAEARHQRRDPVALLDPQFAGARDGDLAAERRQRGERRQFVDQAGHLVRADHDGLKRPRAPP